MVAVHPFDSDDDKLSKIAEVRGQRSDADDVKKILPHSAVQEVEHRVAAISLSVGWRQVDVDPSGLLELVASI